MEKDDLSDEKLDTLAVNMKAILDYFKIPASDRTIETLDAAKKAYKKFESFAEKMFEADKKILKKSK